VKTAEGLAVVEFHPAVSHVHGVQRRGESLAEILAGGKIKRCVSRQVVPWIGLLGKVSGLSFMSSMSSTVFFRLVAR